jgi:hypothetical protein
VDDKPQSPGIAGQSSGPHELTIAPANSEANETAAAKAYLFRGDDNYRGEPVGLTLGADADSADIQDFAAHVLRKESNRSSRFLSFTTEVKVARRFTSASDNRFVRKADIAALRELESQGVIRIWDPDGVEAALAAGPRKLAKQAGDVRATMMRNSEFLIEGQIPAGVLQPTH